MSSLAKRFGQRSPRFREEPRSQPRLGSPGAVKLGHPTLAPSDLFDGQTSYEAGTEENGALVAPGSRAVKHNSYRLNVNFVRRDTSDIWPTKSAAYY